jgi:hypothetical protein
MNANAIFVDHHVTQQPRTAAQNVRANAPGVRGGRPDVYGSFVSVAELASHELRTQGDSMGETPMSRPSPPPANDLPRDRNEHPRDDTVRENSESDARMAASWLGADSGAGASTSSRKQAAVHTRNAQAVSTKLDQVDSSTPSGRIASTPGAGVTATVVVIPKTQLTHDRGGGGGTPVGGIGVTARAARPPLAKLQQLGETTKEHVQRQALAQAALRAVQSTIRKDGGEVTLKLRPEGLGALQVRVEVRQESVWAWLRPTSPTAQRLLDESVEQLRGALESRGLKVEHLVVEALPQKVGMSAEPLSEGASDLSGSLQHGSGGDGSWNGQSSSQEDSGGAGVGQERAEARGHAGTSSERDETREETIPSVLGWIA